MSRFEHVIWDWNGTILDDVEVVVGAINVLLEKRALPLMHAERYREVFAFPVQSYYEAIGFDLVAEPFADLADEWVLALEGRWRDARIRDGVLGVLDALRASAVSCSVLSAAEQALLHQQADHFGLTDRFVRLVGIDDHHAVSKVEHGRRWLSELNAPAGKVLLVGDTVHDVEVAQALGIEIVLIEHGHQSRRRLEATGVPVLSSVDALKTLL